jgi:hypothetical protein
VGVDEQRRISLSALKLQRNFMRHETITGKAVAVASWTAAALCRFPNRSDRPKAAEGYRSPKPDGISTILGQLQCLVNKRSVAHGPNFL